MPILADILVLKLQVKVFTQSRTWNLILWKTEIPSGAENVGILKQVIKCYSHSSGCCGEAKKNIQFLALIFLICLHVLEAQVNYLHASHICLPISGEIHTFFSIC